MSRHDTLTQRTIDFGALSIVIMDESLAVPLLTKAGLLGPDGGPTLPALSATQPAQAAQGEPTLVAQHIYEYPGAVFVAFDPYDDGASIVGAYRTLREAQEGLSRHEDAMEGRTAVAQGAGEVVASGDLSADIVEIARRLHCLSDVCDLTEYSPDFGRVPEYWRPKTFVLDLVTRCCAGLVEDIDQMRKTMACLRQELSDTQPAAGADVLDAEIPPDGALSGRFTYCGQPARFLTKLKSHPGSNDPYRYAIAWRTKSGWEHVTVVAALDHDIEAVQS